MSEMIKKGKQGDNVKGLQEKLAKLGFDVDSDGIFGAKTETAVKELQALFGYTVDGVVGPGTTVLIEQQIAYGWNAKAPNARALAQKSQQKS